MSYKDDIKIDKYTLDSEWLKNTELYLDWGEKEVQAQEELDRAQDALELVKAQLDKSIRSNPAAFGIKDVKEKAIENAIIRDEHYQSCVAAVTEAKKNARMMYLAKRSFSHKEKALSRITDLFLAGYWAEKPVERKLEQAVEKAAEMKFQDDMKSRRLKRRGDGNNVPAGI